MIVGEFRKGGNGGKEYGRRGGEMWGDRDGEIDMLVGGVGSGGRIWGMGK